MKNNTSDRRRGKAEREAESLVSGLLNSPRVVLNLTTHPRRVPLLANATSQLVYSEVTSLFRADKHCMSDKKKPINVPADKFKIQSGYRHVHNGNMFLCTKKFFLCCPQNANNIKITIWCDRCSQTPPSHRLRPNEFSGFEYCGNICANLITQLNKTCFITKVQL